MPHGLRDDDRGLALGIVIFFVMLIIAAVLFIALDTAWVEIVGHVEPRADHQGATEQINMAQSIWNNIMFVPIFFAVLFIIARAVNEGAV